MGGVLISIPIQTQTFGGSVLSRQSSREQNDSWGGEYSGLLPKDAFCLGMLICLSRL